jgi:hypothetical protein
MSAYSSIHVTREAAIGYLLNQIMTADDSRLESLLAEFLSDRLLTCYIDHKGADNDLLR